MNPSRVLLLLGAMTCASCSGLYLYETSKDGGESPPGTSCPEGSAECPEPPQDAGE